MYLIFTFFFIRKRQNPRVNPSTSQQNIRLEPKPYSLYTERKRRREAEDSIRLRTNRRIPLFQWKIKCNSKMRGRKQQGEEKDIDDSFLTNFHEFSRSIIYELDLNINPVPF